jgi:ABC-type Fe3+-citrate transport system substrate-binding protein
LRDIVLIINYIFLNSKMDAIEKEIQQRRHIWEEKVRKQNEEKKKIEDEKKALADAKKNELKQKKLQEIKMAK